MMRRMRSFTKRIADYRLGTVLFLFLNVLLWSGMSLFVSFPICTWLAKSAADSITAILCITAYAGIFGGFIGGVLFLYRQDDDYPM